jgi:hypothetical protein
VFGAPAPSASSVTGTGLGYVVQAVRALRDGQVPRLEVRPDVSAAYDAWVQRRLEATVFATGCHSWYLTASGRNTQNWPASTLTFRRRLRRLQLSDFGAAPVPAPARARGTPDRERLRSIDRSGCR